MEWDDVIKIALTVIGGFGGVFVITGVVIKFSADKIAERLSLKYELKLNKEMESYKSDLEKKNYVSQTRFIAEFNMYQELMEKLEKSFSDVARFTHFITIGEYLTEKQEQYENAYKSTDMLHSAISRYAPFVDKNIYDKLTNLRENLWKQITEMQEITFHKEDIETADRGKQRQSIMDRGKLMKTNFDNFTEELREMLAKREVI